MGSKCCCFFVLCFEVGCFQEPLGFLISPACVSFYSASLCFSFFATVFKPYFSANFVPVAIKRTKLVNLGGALVSSTDVTEHPTLLKTDKVQ